MIYEYSKSNLHPSITKPNVLHFITLHYGNVKEKMGIIIKQPRYREKYEILRERKRYYKNMYAWEEWI